MAEYLNLSEEAFEREWDRRISKGPDDVAQSFTIYELYGQDAGPKPESFYLQIEAGSR